MPTPRQILDLREAVAAKMIALDDPRAAPELMRYVPFWATARPGPGT